VNRTIAIGLGAAAVGALGSILLDHFAHGGTHTVLTVVMITLLIAAALVLHHIAFQMELTMRQQVRATQEEPPQPPHDFDARST
jgi:drug/metabolite transporter (DMT)-like permease